ncbi:unnamed protein product [Closterium sp. Yama58-4]|nr:unnamed protein product [Closterium sp. Yama58-4]
MAFHLNSPPLFPSRPGLDLLDLVWSAHARSDLPSLDALLAQTIALCHRHMAFHAAAVSAGPSSLSLAHASPAATAAALASARYHYCSLAFVSKKLPEAFGLRRTREASDTATSSERLGSANLDRFGGSETEAEIERLFVGSIQRMVSSGSSRENPRHLIRLLVLGAGYPSVRVQAASLLPPWLSSTLHARSARLLLERVIALTQGTTAADWRTLEHLLSIKAKGSQQGGSTLPMEIAAQIVNIRPEYAAFVIKADGLEGTGKIRFCESSNAPLPLLVFPFSSLPDAFAVGDSERVTPSHASARSSSQGDDWAG